MKINYINKNKEIKMVDISKKKDAKRIASAFCSVKFQKSSFNQLMKEGSPKGEIFNLAKCSGILAAKKTDELIPLCHNINLSSIEINYKKNLKKHTIEIHSTVKTNSNTGVEMEALTACSIAALTIYDMCKAIDKSICIQDLKLLYKSGGRSGIFKNEKIF